MTIDGWNLIHLSGTRLCSTAKPSMQKWMKSLVEELKAANNPLSEYLVPKASSMGSAQTIILRDAIFAR